jgi:hypothetical protein
MLPFRPIKSLYPLALAEGEGVGTAYEYFAKRLVLKRWLAVLPPHRKVLIAGLPQKYGSSLDFLLLAEELGASNVVIVDDRPATLDKARQSLAAAQQIGQLLHLRPEYVCLSEWGELETFPGGYDLCLASEVLQRLDDAGRQSYIACLAGLASALALFTPNADDPAHTTLSGLAGLRLPDLRRLAESAGSCAASGYVDMPPFPPGLTRSTEQRKQASAGRLEATAMWGLGYYARAERYFPLSWRRGHAHIVYALVKTDASSNHRTKNMKLPVQSGVKSPSQCARTQ